MKQKKGHKQNQPFLNERKKLYQNTYAKLHHSTETLKFFKRSIAQRKTLLQNYTFQKTPNKLKTKLSNSENTIAKSNFSNRNKTQKKVQKQDRKI